MRDRADSLPAIDRTEVLTRYIDGRMPWTIAVMFRHRVWRPLRWPHAGAIIPVRRMRAPREGER